MVIFPISIFSQIRSEGGVIKYHFFPKFKIVHIILGGGSWKLWTFSTIWDIFFLECSPNQQRSEKIKWNYNIHLAGLLELPVWADTWTKIFWFYHRYEWIRFRLINNYLSRLFCFFKIVSNKATSELNKKMIVRAGLVRLDSFSFVRLVRLW